MNFDKLTSYLDSLPEKNIPGCDCAVFREDKVIYRHQSGYSDLENNIPMTPDRTYFIYSATKVFTAAAMMTVLEKEWCSLNDPLSEYIPEYGNMWVSDGVSGLRRAENAITLRHLLTMTSGLGYDYKSPSILKTLEENSGSPTLKQIIEAYAAEPLFFEPGTDWKYSFSLDVIGRVIEIVSGMSFGDYLYESLFGPLEMTDTGFSPTPGLLGRMAAQYELDREKQLLERTDQVNYLSLGDKYESGGAGLISTVDDCIKFVCMLISGGVSPKGEKIIDRRYIDLMRTNQLSGKALESFWWRSSGFGYGLGVRTLTDKSITGTKGSLGEFGWYGARGFWLAVDPDNKTAIVYAQNRGPSDSGLIQPPIREYDYEALEDH